MENTWREPGNFNSNLSALTWTAQLILFDFVCFQKQDDEDEIPDLLDQMCMKYFQQMAEKPFGHILQWRQYLFAVSSTELAGLSMGGTIDYMGTKLHMEQVTQLVESEFREAHSLDQ
ncbi:telomere-associated recq helicase [Fusarium mundagurra]|uniref:Telomere-associated recq helicase n=1 Tax=Fusarium mundagurra TaxID=1567541 RepID=A0A8H5Y505_9HYPO|nr:telomere-associated recq helicase [Fusarium mundagurra]